MHYILLYTDKPGTQALRIEVRPKHRDFIKGESHGAKLVLAGPTESPEGAAGSMLVVECENYDSARAFTTIDPYVTSGVVQSVEIRAWKWVTGNPGAA
jgi:uncharacterized protein